MLPEPYAPAGVDLRKKPFMPLYGHILIGSKAWNLAPLEARGPMLQLWWHAFSQQVPAGTLPDDDADWQLGAGLGAAPEVWERCRHRIMAGWVKCSDGRWHHKFLADLIHDLVGKRKIKAAEMRDYRDRKSANKPHVGDGAADVGGKTANVGDQGREGKGSLGKGSEEPSPNGDGIAPPKKDPDLLPEKPKQESTANLQLAVDAYNAVARDFEWPQCQTLSETRKRSLRARLTEAGGLEGWLAAMDKARASGFLTGRRGRARGHEGWVPDFDFFIQAKSFTLLMEGKYDDRQGPQTANGAGPNGDSATQRALRGLLAADLRPGGSGRDGAD